MRKISLVITLAVLMIFALPTVADAKEPEEYINEYSALIPEGIPTDPDDTDGLTESVSFSAILSFALEQISGRRSEIISFFLLLFGAVALSSLGVSAFENMSEGVRRGVSIISSAALFSSLFPVLRAMASSLGDANAFFSSAAPVMCAISLAAGGSASASVGVAGASLTAAFVATVSSKMLPFLGTLALASSLLGSFGGSVNIAESAKRLYTRIFGMLALLISITLSLQTVIASSTDSALMRAAKYGATTLIPSVGGVVSSAMSTLVSGLSYAKGVVGASAVGVILYIFVSPLLLLLLYRLGMSVAQTLSELLGQKDSVAISPFIALVDAFIASYVISCLMYVLEFVLFMKGGVGA